MKHIQPLLKFRESGDTIVEVMISMAILGVILAGAYVTSNRALNTERDSQEHTHALTLAQGQVESLLAASSADPNIILPAPDTCFDQTTGQPTHTGCAISNNGAVYSSCPTTLYCYVINDTISGTVTLPEPGGPVTLTAYEVTVTWPRLGGGINSVQLYYRP